MKTVTVEQFKSFRPCWLETAKGRKRDAAWYAALAAAQVAAWDTAWDAAWDTAREHEVKMLRELLEEGDKQ